MFKDIREVLVDNWVIRYHAPADTEQHPVFLMLHGWTGDENSMWVFAPRLPKNALLIAPRGLYTTQNGGYSWHAGLSRRWPGIDDFVPAIDRLLDAISYTNFPMGDFSKLNLLGFSQGAALSYCLTILHPGRVASLAGMSGFMPVGSSDRINGEALKGLPVFITHGTEDKLVPVERARASVDILQKAGASVTYCEDNVGHKLSAKCFRGLEAFYAKIIPG